MENIDEIAMSHFPNINREQALQRPILYSNWMDKNYIPVDREELRHYVKARLVFYEKQWPPATKGLLYRTSKVET